MMMKTVISNTQSLDHILRCYSGRRLQFAIKLGMLPKPESLATILTKDTSILTRGASARYGAMRIVSSRRTLII
jgi:hypothetical protein